MSTNGSHSDRDLVVRDLRGGERFLLLTHENPDGDALGSLVAMHAILVAQGKDSAMYISPDEFPLAYEYRFFDLEGLVSVWPEDHEERTLVFLDCGNIERNPGAENRSPRRGSSTSTTTTTTRSSGRSTWWTPRPPAPPRSCGTSCASSVSRPRRRSPRRSTSGSSPTPGGSCTRTRARAPT